MPRSRCLSFFERRREQALRTEGKDDDTQWLTYWTVFGSFTLIDFFAETVLSWFPFYYLLKAVFLVYLFLPQTMGALAVSTSSAFNALAALQGRRGPGGDAPRRLHRLDDEDSVNGHRLPSPGHRKTEK